jgi:hypothetical protein
LGIAGMNGVGDQANVSLTVKSRKWRFQLQRAASALPQEVDVAAFAAQGLVVCPLVPAKAEFSLET